MTWHPQHTWLGMWWQFYASPSPRECRPFSAFFAWIRRTSSAYEARFSTPLLYLNTPLFFLNFTQYFDVLNWHFRFVSTEILFTECECRFTPLVLKEQYLVMYKSSYHDSCCSALLPFSAHSVILAAKHERLIRMKGPICIKVNLSNIRKQTASQSKYGEEGKTYKLVSRQHQQRKLNTLQVQIHINLLVVRFYCSEVMYCAINHFTKLQAQPLCLYL